MSEEKKEGEKVQCKCGSVVFVKNMGAHQKTKKHITAVGGTIPPPTKPSRSSGYVDFAAAQKKKYATRDQEISDDELEEEDELEEDGFEDDVIEALEDIEKHLEEQLILQNEVRSSVNELRVAFGELKNSISNLTELMKQINSTQERTPNTNSEPRNAKERL